MKTFMRMSWLSVLVTNLFAVRLTGIFCSIFQIVFLQKKRNITS